MRSIRNIFFFSKPEIFKIEKTKLKFSECSMPMEYCDYSGQTDLCRAWATQNAPELLEGLEISEENADGADEKKKQKRGGKGSKTGGPTAATKKKGAQKVTLQREPRGKKSVTVIKGLATFGKECEEFPKILTNFETFTFTRIFS